MNNRTKSDMRLAQCLLEKCQPKLYKLGPSIAAVSSEMKNECRVKSIFVKII